MSDLIQGLDVIFKLIPQLKSLTGVRRQDCYTKLLTPLFDSFQEVHGFYNTLNLQTRSAVVEVASEVSSNSGEPLKIEQMTTMRKLKEGFMQRRRRDEFLRDALRREAQDIFTRIKWSEERRFLASVSYYFLGSGGIAPSDEYLDRDVQEVIERGGNTCWDTPSTKLYKAIQEEHSPDRVIEFLDESRNSLNQLYMNVRHHYSRVQQEIILGN
jgi:hypothetical protein